MGTGVVRRVAVHILTGISHTASGGKVAGTDVKVAVGVNGPGDAKSGRWAEFQIVRVEYGVGPWVIELLLEYATHLCSDVSGHRWNAHIDASEIKVTVLPRIWTVGSWWSRRGIHFSPAAGRSGCARINFRTFAFCGLVLYPGTFGSVGRKRDHWVHRLDAVLADSIAGSTREISPRSGQRND